MQFYGGVRVCWLFRGFLSCCYLRCVSGCIWIGARDEYIYGASQGQANYGVCFLETHATTPFPTHSDLTP